MPHSKFGWSYPAGCSGPDDGFVEPSDLVDEILGVLEDAGAPTAINDQIVKLIETWERKHEAELDAAEGAPNDAAEEPDQ